MSKQTAVEWLIEMISYTSKDTHSAMESSNFFEQSLAMEREQIEDAWHDGRSPHGALFLGDYLENTYGKEASHEL